MDPNGGPQRFEAAKMQVDRPVSNDTASRQRDGGFFFPTEQRPKDTNRRAHLSDNIIRRNGIDFLGFDRDHPARSFDFCSQMVQDLQHVMHIAEIRNPMDDARFFGQQGRSQNRQGRVF
jgi:hypothetical protein